MNTQQIPAHRWTWPARVVRVVDGDTLDVELDAGFRSVRSERLRLLGVNTPEMVGASRPAGIAAKQYTIDWIDAQRNERDEWPFVIETAKGVDSFGRYLVVLWARLTGDCLNTDLLVAGHAVEDIRP